MNPDELEELEERHRLKKTYHRMGVPVGVGAANETPTAEQLQEERMRQAEEEQREEDTVEQMAMGAAHSDFQSRLIAGDKAQIVKFIHEAPPYIKSKLLDAQGNIIDVVKEGVVSLEAYMTYSAWLHPTAGLSFLNEKELRVRECDLDLYELEVMFCEPRNEFTPQRMKEYSAAKSASQLKMHNNFEGIGLKLATIEVSEEIKDVGIRQNKKRSLSNLASAIRGSE